MARAWDSTRTWTSCLSKSQINYQTQYNMSYQHYLLQVQAYGQGLNKKVQDQQDLQFLSAVQWQQQHQEV